MQKYRVYSKKYNVFVDVEVQRGRTDDAHMMAASAGGSAFVLSYNNPITITEIV